MSSNSLSTLPWKKPHALPSQNTMPSTARSKMWASGRYERCTSLLAVLTPDSAAPAIIEMMLPCVSITPWEADKTESKQT
jgi:hypothetical protein